MQRCSWGYLKFGRRIAWLVPRNKIHLELANDLNVNNVMMRWSSFVGRNGVILRERMDKLNPLCGDDWAIKRNVVDRLNTSMMLDAELAERSWLESWYGYIVARWQSRHTNFIFEMDVVRRLITHQLRLKMYNNLILFYIQIKITISLKSIFDK